MISQSPSSINDKDPLSVTPPVYAAVSRAGGATQPHTAAITVNMPAGSICFIQNLSTTELLRVKLGEGASGSSFDFIIPALTNATTGVGVAAPLVIDRYVGPVSTFSASTYSYTLSLLT